MVKGNADEAAAPKFYGSTTIGERGQIVIPSEARKDLHITPSTKLLVFGSMHGEGLTIVKAESVTELLAKATEMLKGLESAVRSDPDTPHRQRSQSAEEGKQSQNRSPALPGKL